ncbi:hypothetical protein BH10ACI4_BH10ACI4_18160 [soil metagenome]
MEALSVYKELPEHNEDVLQDFFGGDFKDQGTAPEAVILQD